MPTKLERSLEAFTPDIDVVYTDHEQCSADLSEGLETARGATPEGNILLRLLGSVRALFPSHAALIRRTAADRTRMFREELRIAEDWYFWIELAVRGAVFRYVDEVLVRYRATPGSLSKDPVKMAAGRLQAAEALRQLPVPEGFDLAAFLADRHHVLGLRLWDAADRAGARDQFRQAIDLSRPTRHGQVSERYLLLMTYFALTAWPPN